MRGDEMDERNLKKLREIHRKGIESVRECECGYEKL